METTEDKASAHRRGENRTVKSLQGRKQGPVVNMNGPVTLQLCRQARSAMVLTQLDCEWILD